MLTTVVGGTPTFLKRNTKLLRVIRMYHTVVLMQTASRKGVSGQIIVER